MPNRNRYTTIFKNFLYFTAQPDLFPVSNFISSNHTFSNCDLVCKGSAFLLDCYNDDIAVEYFRY